MKRAIRKFDLLCIGNSSANLAAAQCAIKYKKAPCIISQTLKNEWIDREAIERKLLYHAAQVYLNSGSAAEYGVWTDKHDKYFNKFTLNLKIFNEKAKNYIDFANEQMRRECARKGITLIKDTAKFITPTSVALHGSNTSIQGDKVLISITREDTRCSISKLEELPKLSLIHICRCRRYAVCRSRWSPYH
eukprot:TRINITY_DN5257_c0_g2_i1.p1 TRINITY_DN5257_c0_g2~~TRINITY_DN5257_c0_g2_i1.p1  ORF type:complete len:190 (-),score=31.61 TRINITY_DN5257_c0_g2_i1:10-579(-)